MTRMKSFSKGLDANRLNNLSTNHIDYNNPIKNISFDFGQTNKIRTNTSNNNNNNNNINFGRAIDHDDTEMSCCDHKILSRL